MTTRTTAPRAPATDPATGDAAAAPHDVMARALAPHMPAATQWPLEARAPAATPPLRAPRVRRAAATHAAPTAPVRETPAFPFDASTITPERLARFPYCAFGSNLNKKQMAWRCPAARPGGPGRLMDFRLVFRRVADVVFCPGDEVPVGLWHVTRSCVESLDRYEGFPRVYQRRFVLVHTHAGPVWSFVYVMTGRELEPPKQEYFDTIRAGYTHFDLPHPVLHAARRASFPRPTAVNSKRGNT